MCSETLQLDSTPKVNMSRIGDSNREHNRPIKVCFDQLWDKRKFLGSLFKLKLNDKFRGVHISHDMCQEDRAENKRLLKEAYQLNQVEKPETFRY